MATKMLKPLYNILACNQHYLYDLNVYMFIYCNQDYIETDSESLRGLVKLKKSEKTRIVQTAPTHPPIQFFFGNIWNFFYLTKPLNSHGYHLIVI